jgi:predicted phage terminase large subunit-like protein
MPSRTKIKKPSSKSSAKKGLSNLPPSLLNALSTITLSQVKTHLAEKSLAEFTRAAFTELEPETLYRHGWHIDAICEHLEAVSNYQLRKLLITVPPGHMKSLLTCVMWPAWEWLRFPWLRWIFASYGHHLSTRDSNKTRQLMRGPWYQARWADRFQITKDSETWIQNDKGGFRISTSVDGVGTGERVHRIVNDDLLKATEAMSEAKRENAIEHLRAMSTRAVDPELFCQVLIMQRLHEADPAGYVMEQGGWEHLCLPAEFETSRKCVTSIGWQDPRKSEGEFLWPIRYGRQEIDELKRALGSYAASGQLQQRPAPAEGGIIKRAWFRRFDSRERPPTFDQIILSADPKFKDFETASRVALHVWGRIGPNKYLLARDIGHFGIVESLAAIARLRAEWHRPADGLTLDAYLIEDKANGPAIVQVMQKKVAGVIAWPPRGSKEARIIAVSPQMEAGNIWIPQEPWGDEVIDALCFVPNGDNWDDVDACSQALDYFGRSDDATASQLFGFGSDMSSAQQQWPGHN